MGKAGPLPGQKSSLALQKRSLSSAPLGHWLWALPVTSLATYLQGLGLLRTPYHSSLGPHLAVPLLLRLKVRWF